MDFLWIRQSFEEVSKGLRLTKGSVQPKPFQIAYGASRCYTHTSSLPRFTSTWIYILIAVVGVLPIMKVNKCKSRQRAGNSGVETAAAIADRNREVCERMCRSNMIHSTYILMQTGKHLSGICVCAYDWNDLEFSLCYKLNLLWGSLVIWNVEMCDLLCEV